MDDFKIMCYIFCVWDLLILILLVIIVGQIKDLRKEVMTLGESNIKELKDINKNTRHNEENKP